ncbi:MAG TPA: methyltransferase domain-containing protein [Casimicrobiaceae bacterium]|nr:methyltransferase domain-containing protein [Casimicrobiaceae bacterium]
MRSGPFAAARPLARRIRTQLRRYGLAPGMAGVRRAPRNDADAIAFHCNLCGAANRTARMELDRERPSCVACGSNVRFRAIGRLVVRELTGRDASLYDLPRTKEWRGLGLSDDATYAMPIASKFDYVNTYFHAEPRLDIANADVARYGGRDFIVASEVFEHIAPPVARAFVNAHALLREGGKLIFTVPFTLDPDTVEHFPELHAWTLETRDGRWRLRNRTADGRETLHDNPIFHGGPGTTLEMRVFSQAALLREFERAGFSRVRIAAEPCLEFGIHWPAPWSVPMVAYR